VDGFLREFGADAARARGSAGHPPRHRGALETLSPWRDLVFDRFAAWSTPGPARRHRMDLGTVSRIFLTREL